MITSTVLSASPCRWEGTSGWQEKAKGITAVFILKLEPRESVESAVHTVRSTSEHTIVIDCLYRHVQRICECREKEVTIV